MKLDRLEELRDIHNLTQVEIANILGVARTTYAGYESGTREMDYKTLIKLADFYKVSLDYIFGRTKNPVQHVSDNYSDDEIEFMFKALSLYREMKEKIK